MKAEPPLYLQIRYFCCYTLSRHFWQVGGGGRDLLVKDREPTVWPSGETDEVGKNALSNFVVRFASLFDNFDFYSQEKPKNRTGKTRPEKCPVQFCRAFRPFI